jgi:hypothetical protein
MYDSFAVCLLNERKVYQLIIEWINLFNIGNVDLINIGVRT